MVTTERFLRTLHGWLGVFILPWVVVAGFTGLYMNHGKMVLGWLPDAVVGVESFVPGGVMQTPETAAARAEALIGPAEGQGGQRQDGRAVLVFDGDGQRALVDRDTGHVTVQSRYLRRLYAPDGHHLATDIRWSRVLSSLHRRGFVGEALGTWLADITAGALMVFGLSGLVLFFAPRLRRLKNRRARARFERARAPAP